MSDEVCTCQLYRHHIGLAGVEQVTDAKCPVHGDERRTTSHRITTTRAGNGVVEINVTPRETR